MRKFFLTIVLMLVAFVAFGKKKPKVEETYGKANGKVYLFGVSQMLNDSVIYLTNIHEVDSIALEKKTHFLPYRSEFSLQLKEYTEGRLHLKHQTSCVFFSNKRKKISKKFYKIKKRYLDNKNTKIVMLDESKFAFRHPLDAIEYEEDNKGIQ